jgi:hypothetical protein
MNESYYVFKRYSLFRVSLIFFSLPFFVCLLISIVSYNMYQYATPWLWICVTSIPLFFVGYNIKIEIVDDKLIISRYLFMLRVLTTNTHLCNPKSVSWIAVDPKSKVFQLIFDNRKTNLFVDS